MIVAIDDVFVVPLPTAFKVTGFFQPASHSSIAADARDDVVRKLAEASSGWNAVAVGASGRPGLALKAASEQNAVSESLGNCAKSDRDCRIIAIGPFSVAPN
jgi:adenylate cyclase